MGDELAGRAAVIKVAAAIRVAAVAADVKAAAAAVAGSMIAGVVEARAVAEKAKEEVAMQLSCQTGWRSLPATRTRSHRSTCATNESSSSRVRLTGRSKCGAGKMATSSACRAAVHCLARAQIPCGPLLTSLCATASTPMLVRSCVNTVQAGGPVECVLVFAPWLFAGTAATGNAPNQRKCATRPAQSALVRAQ